MISAVEEWSIPCQRCEIIPRDNILSKEVYSRFFSCGLSTDQTVAERGKFVQGESRQQAFQEFKECLVTAPIPCYPTEKGRYIVDTNASNVGMGVVFS